MPVFVDEIALQTGTRTNGRASPDWTLIFEDQIWMIELKTEPLAATAPPSCPHYLDLASHHLPGRAIDVTWSSPR